LLTLALGAAGALILLSALAACHKEEKAASQAIRPVRTVTVELQEGGEKVSLTGEIQPRYQADIGFRVNGKILERPVDVGTQVKKGDLLVVLESMKIATNFNALVDGVASVRVRPGDVVEQGTVLCDVKPDAT